MALTLTTADSALKEDYQPGIREELNNTIMMLKQVESNSVDVEGRRAVLSLHVSRNSGVGARAEGGTLPTAGNQGYAEERVPLRFNYGRIQVSGPVIKAMKSDTGSFVRAIDSETKGVVNDLKRDVNRQIFGTSDGVIAQCGTSGPSTTVTLVTGLSKQAFRQLEVGMLVDIGTVASPTLIVGGAKITASNFATPSITIDSAVSVTGVDFVFRAGAGGSGASQKELTGLQTIVSATGAVFNVDPATQPVWASYSDTSGGTPNDVKFELATDTIQINSGQDPDLIVTTDGVSRAYAATLQAQKRFQNTLELKGGFKAISVTTPKGEIGLTWDRDCPKGDAFVLNTEHLKQHQSSDWQFMDEDGSVLFRVSGQDAYEATLFKYHEVTTDARNTHGILTGLTEA